MNGRRFVQFPHPGGEHKPDRSGQKAWNTLDRPHARKFMQFEGTWLEDTNSEDGKVWAWGEWEPESLVIRSLNAVTHQHPHFLWKPYWVRKSRYVGLHNTDPFIYDGFYYTDCKQGGTPALEGLRHLDKGSIIVFGSAKKPNWALDTVLVVRESIDYDRETYKERLAERVPECYWDVTLAPSYQGPDKLRRLYIGATHNNPVCKMFSFFPCMPAGNDTGFVRPSIELPSRYFNVALLQGARGHSLNSESLAIETLQDLWMSIAKQVVAKGLRLGTAARSPSESLATQER